jgi:lysophospholipase L1-like esterase
MIYGTILCVGDSLVTGARDKYGLGMPRYLSDCLSIRDQTWVAVDEGENGETSSALLRRYYKVLRAYPEAKDVVLCIGTNDAKTPAVPAEVFRRNYSELLRTSAVLKKFTYCCLIPKRNGFGAPDYIDNDFVGQYNDVIEGLLDHFPLTWIVDLTGIRGWCRDDGVHLNARGNLWFAQTVASAIRKARS